MAVENLEATGYDTTTPVVQNGYADKSTIITRSVEVTAAASALSTYTFARIPTCARIHPNSQLFWDDLASTGSPTIDIGLYGVDGNFTDDPDALNDGLDAATANTGARVLKDIANYGKRVWELLGLSADPRGFADVKASIQDAATNTGGTLTLMLVYSTN